MQPSSALRASELAEPKQDPENKLKGKRAKNLWHRIGNGIELADIDHRLVDAKIAWYQQHQSHLDRVAERANPFLYLIVEEIDAQDMPLDLALLPIVESAYQPLAYSRHHAAGLWQFIPSTGTRFGLEQNRWYDGRRDVLASTQAALDYLKNLHDQFGGDWLLALAAYNCGEAHVAKAIELNRNAGRPADFWSLNLPSETRHYVRNLLALSSIVQKPEEYDVRLKPIPNKPVLIQVKASKRFDLRQAARLAGLSAKQIRAYNPGFKNWITGPSGPHSVLVPRPRALGLTNKLANLSLPRAEPSQDTDAGPTHGRNRFHIVQKGETLWHIAERYDTSVDRICAWNKLSPARPLSPYRKLVILAKNAEPASPFFKASGKNARDLVHQQFRYRVKKGDSLWSIARRFGVSLVELCQWNRLSERYHLQPGQNLTIYIEPTAV